MPKIMFNGVEYAGSGGGGGGSTWITDIPEMHRNIFRGQSLGSSVTTAQLAAIEDGSFDELYVGDYWTINNVVWRIVDIDHYLGKGAAWQITAHHLVIMPDTALYVIAMNTQSYYYARSTVLADAKTAVSAAFPDMVIPYSEFFGDGNNPIRTDDSEIEIPDILSVTGNTNLRKGNDVPSTHTESYQQFALFRLAPKYANCVGGYWFRNISILNGNDYVAMSGDGRPGLNTYNRAFGVRPYFLIGVQNE